MKIPSAAGNIWLASMPTPNATFWPKGMFFVSIDDTLRITLFVTANGINGDAGRPLKAVQEGKFCD